MTIYLVRRHDGTFRSHSYTAYWVKDMQDARVYPKPGPAKSLATSWKRGNPDEPAPMILSFTFSEHDGVTFDQTERIAKVSAAKERRDAERKKADIEMEQKYLQEKMDSINQRMAALKNV